MDVGAVMRKIGKNIYILSDDNYISIDGEDIVVKNSEENKIRIPAILVENIVVFGNTTITSSVIRFCSKHNINLTYASAYGKIYGRFVGEFNRCIVLRKQQYDIYNTERAFEIPKNIMLAKFINSKNTLMQCAKDSVDDNKREKLLYAVEQISSIKEALFNCNNDKELMGIEGRVAQIYFGVFDNMLKTKDENMLFVERSKRPPENFCNCLLSFLYVLYTNDITAALESVGLDSYLGYNHKIHPGRQSLSLDLLEEFRSCIVDKFVITLINRKQITSKDFETKNNEIKLNENGRKKLLKLWEEYKSNTIYHNYYDKKVEIKLLPYLQAQLLAQFIRGDIDNYPAFVK